MFGDKQATIERFKETYRTRLTDDIQARLVLENDEVRPIAKLSVSYHPSLARFNRCVTTPMTYCLYAKSSTSLWS